MAKKKIYRAGVIPYIIEDGEIHMLFMKPSKTKYGGNVFQIAKGKYEQGETAMEAGMREAKEELGLFGGNVEHLDELGTFMGRTTIFVAQIKDKDMFGEPHFETAEVKWMTPQDFQSYGRDLHRPVVKAAVRKINKLVQEQFVPGEQINEIFDSRPEEIIWTVAGDTQYGHFEIEGNWYAVLLESASYAIDGQAFSFVNAAFGAVDDQHDNQLDFNLQHFKTSPMKVLGGVLKAIDEKQHWIDKHDAVIMGVSDRYEDPHKRIKLYDRIASIKRKHFRMVGSGMKTKNGMVTFMINANYGGDIKASKKAIANVAVK